MDHLKIIIAVIFFLATGIRVNAQERIKTDNKEAKTDSVSVSTKQEHSPRKATIYSAVLPGLGQIYNKKYWKVPIIYAGLATLIYCIDWNNDYYVKYKKAYSDITDSDPTTNSFKDLDIEGSWDFTNSSQVQQFTERLDNAMTSARRYRDLCIIGTAALYALNIIDASVDAHFFNFNLNDDLTVNWTPQPVMCMNQRLVGINCIIRF